MLHSLSITFLWLQVAKESWLQLEMKRWREKSEALEDLLKSKTDLMNKQILENSELKKKQDTLQLNFEEINEVCLFW